MSGRSVEPEAPATIEFQIADLGGVHGDLLPAMFLGQGSVEQKAAARVDILRGAPQFAIPASGNQFCKENQTATQGGGSQQQPFRTHVQRVLFTTVAFPCKAG